MNEEKEVLKDDVSEEIVEQERDQEEIDREERRKKNKRRSLLKLNLVSLFFTAVSFISVTLAWFAYSGLITTQTEVDVKAWYIEFNKNGTAVSNNIVIALDDVYPGMDIMSEVIDIKNSGDSAAMIDYKIKSVRILDKELTVDDTGELEDELSHNYPFHINMALSNTFANAKTGTGNFSVSVSWPLDSETVYDVDNELGDKADTDWGTKAYQFQKAEAEAASKDKTYQARSSIEIVISLEAVQYIGEGDAPDSRFPFGKTILYDPVNNQRCTSLEGSCITTYVLDKNNNYSNGTVKLLPVIDGTNIDGWTVSTTNLSVKDILPVISKDIVSSVMVGSDVSNQLIGFMDYGTRIDTTISNTVKYNGYFRFKNENFPLFIQPSCVWLEEDYGSNKKFALVQADELYSKIYPEDVSSTCKILPVIQVSKAKFN